MQQKLSVIRIVNPTKELPKINFLNDPDICSLADSSIFEIYDKAVEHFDSGIFVELGVFNGGSCLYLANKIKEANKNIKIYAVDLWENVLPDNPAGNIFFKFWENVVKYRFTQIIRPLCCDSARAASLFDSVEFVFVDADHNYDGCMRDFRAWWPKTKWIAGHDYNQKVELAVHHYFEDELNLEVQNIQSMSFLIEGK